MSTIFQYPRYKGFDNSGNPLVGGLLYTYAAGSSTPKASYSEYTCTTTNTNPVVLDSRGEAVVYLSGAYKFVLKDSDGVTIATDDNLGSSSSSATAWGTPTAKTLTAAGEFTVDSGVNSYTLDTFGGASAQSLTKINGGNVGDSIQLQISNVSHVVTVANSTDIRIGTNFKLDTLYDRIVLTCHAANVWVQQFRSANDV